MRYGSETIKIMEAAAEHDFGSTWLDEVHCASDFAKERRAARPAKSIRRKAYSRNNLFINYLIPKRT